MDMKTNYLNNDKKSLKVLLVQLVQKPTPWAIGIGE